jgi:hypothetical protein
MLNKIYRVSILASVLFPAVAFAQTLTKTSGLLGSAKSIVTGILIPLVFTLALLFFFWGVAQYIWSQGDAKEDGRKRMIWGIVALFVMSTVWGLVAFLQSELLGGPGQTDMKIPTIGGGGGGGSGNGGCVADPFSGNPCP